MTRPPRKKTKKVPNKKRDRTKHPRPRSDVLTHRVILIEPLVRRSHLGDALHHLLQLRNHRVLLGVQEEGGLLAPDHEEHVHPGGLEEGGDGGGGKPGPAGGEGEGRGRGRGAGLGEGGGGPGIGRLLVHAEDRGDQGQGVQYNIGFFSLF